ncbi:membrane protein, partial [Candidatus Endoriftia persephone str. Guaymas]|nr:membrane protein [Candidatus Endoriftia persephone str. Guaymas]
CIEFFADKTPGVDTGWDVLHTFVRIPAGAILAAGAASGFEVSEAAQLAAALAGGTLAAGSHLTKASSRVLINTSPEPVTNWTASIAEDLVVIGGLWTALHYPLTFLVLLALFILLVAWLLPKIWRTLKKLIHRLGELFRRKGRDVEPRRRKDILQQLYHDAGEKGDRSG